MVKFINQVRNLVAHCCNVPGARFTKYLTTNLGKTYDKLRIFLKIFCKSGPSSTM